MARKKPEWKIRLDAIADRQHADRAAEHDARVRSRTIRKLHHLFDAVDVSGEKLCEAVGGRPQYESLVDEAGPIGVVPVFALTQRKAMLNEWEKRVRRLATYLAGNSWMPIVSNADARNPAAMILLAVSSGESRKKVIDLLTAHGASCNWREVKLQILNSIASQAAIRSDVKHEARRSAASESGPALGGGYYTPKQLAEKFGVESEALRKRLERFRRKSMTGWTEIENPARHEAKFLYEEETVRRLIESKASR